MKATPEDVAKALGLRQPRLGQACLNEGHARRRGEGHLARAAHSDPYRASMKATPEDVAKRKPPITT